jgi:hypothetical protein
MRTWTVLMRAVVEAESVDEAKALAATGLKANADPRWDKAPSGPWKKARIRVYDETMLREEIKDQ